MLKQANARVAFHLAQIEAVWDGLDWAEGSIPPTPSLKPRPTGLTSEQEVCLSLADLLYVQDLALCVGITDPKIRQICIKSAEAEYCRNFDSCLEA